MWVKTIYSARSALDSTHQNHIDREGLRLTFGHLVTTLVSYARVGQSPIPMDYGQPLFVWLSRD